MRQAFVCRRCRKIEAEEGLVKEAALMKGTAPTV
jgi:hypothetical protein